MDNESVDKKNDCVPKKMSASVDRKNRVCWVRVWVWSVECGLLTVTVPYLGNPPDETIISSGRSQVTLGDELI